MFFRGCVFALALMVLAPQTVLAAEPFKFEAVKSLDDMQAYLDKNMPVGTAREAARKTFVEEGKATLKVHPNRPDTEKYIYDINLCDYYVWRWNISADYDQSGKLVRAYLNGRDDPRVANIGEKADDGGKAAIYKGERPRPQAHKGEKSLAYMMLDRDSDRSTIDDQKLIGAGPSQPDPTDMGRMVVYQDVDPWRSIFDPDDADQIVAFAGDCSAVAPEKKQ